MSIADLLPEADASDPLPLLREQAAWPPEKRYSISAP
jgi:hypothetical protein